MNHKTKAMLKVALEVLVSLLALFACFVLVALVLTWGLQPLNDVEPLNVVEKVGKAWRGE